MYIVHVTSKLLTIILFRVVSWFRKEVICSIYKIPNNNNRNKNIIKKKCLLYNLIHTVHTVQVDLRNVRVIYFLNKEGKFFENISKFTTVC